MYININHDFSCLEEDQFLNDVIINFYLKYFMAKDISEEQRDRAFVFDTFFYECLAHQKHLKKSMANNLAPEWRRYHHVEKWTKNINIFEKDFLIFPINTKYKYIFFPSSKFKFNALQLLQVITGVWLLSVLPGWYQ